MVPAALPHWDHRVWLARRYGEWLTALRDRAEAEHLPVSELPVRIRHARSEAAGRR